MSEAKLERLEREAKRIRPKKVDHARAIAEAKRSWRELQEWAKVVLAEDNETVASVKEEIVRADADSMASCCEKQLIFELDTRLHADFNPSMKVYWSHVLGFHEPGRDPDHPWIPAAAYAPQPQEPPVPLPPVSSPETRPSESIAPSPPSAPVPPSKVDRLLSGEAVTIAPSEVDGFAKEFGERRLQCASCGKRGEAAVGRMLPDDEWKRRIPSHLQDKVLCDACIDSFPDTVPSPEPETHDPEVLEFFRAVLGRRRLP